MFRRRGRSAVETAVNPGRPNGASGNSQGCNPWYRVWFFLAPKGLPMRLRVTPLGSLRFPLVRSRVALRSTSGYFRLPLRGNQMSGRHGGAPSPDHRFLLREQVRAPRGRRVDEVVGVGVGEAGHLLPEFALRFVRAIARRIAHESKRAVFDRND